MESIRFSRIRHFSQLITPLARIRNIRFLLLGVAAGGMTLMTIAGGSAIFSSGTPFRTALLQRLGIEEPSKPAVEIQTQMAPKAVPAQQAAVPAVTPAPVAASAPAPAVSKPVVKYKTSPDPRSDAWSSTPPVPAAQDVNITIDSPGQVPPGTKIVYSAEKEYTVYYGGDLVFNTPTIVFHKSQSLFSDWLTVSSPDGYAITTPTNPWYDTNPSAWVSYTGNPGVATSWSIRFNISSALTLGTHQAHITVWRTGGTGTFEWEYDGFITLDVES
ncbi:MAG TPA: hypothetical protein VFT53_01630 [Candidatus Saccharimonadales bacterium]|nr:hypothetical protein [Candidatus Saccharimonadales bacterium]